MKSANQFISMKVLTHETNPHPFQAKLTSSNSIFNTKNPLNDSTHLCHRSTAVSSNIDIVRLLIQLHESAQRQYTSLPLIHRRFSTFWHRQTPYSVHIPAIDPPPFQATLTSSDSIFNSKSPLNDSTHPCHWSTAVSAPLTCFYLSVFVFARICESHDTPSWILSSEFSPSFGFSPFYWHPLLPSLEGRAADTTHILLRLGSFSVAVK